MNSLILLLPLFGVYFGILRPRQKAMKAQQDSNRNVAVHDEVMTTSGIYATVVAIDDNTASLEIAPGTVIRMDRRAIARRVPKAIGPGNEGLNETPNTEASA